MQDSNQCQLNADVQPTCRPTVEYACLLYELLLALSHTYITSTQTFSNFDIISVSFIIYGHYVLHQLLPPVRPDCGY